MRAIVQRVSSASVSVDEKVVGKINKGYFILFGVKKGDTKEDAEFLVKKISALRIMADEKDKMNLNLEKSGGECLVVSQFTLHANTNDGNRPSFINAAGTELAKELYDLFVNGLRGNNIKTETGEFGAFMNIEANLNGPSTIIYDTSHNDTNDN